ncbi:unnamed protein product [Macrosiphum euphorbiae]|uniref:Uncharacterized protein n=1 Tax=Macrosiphum euphorbiae TaxID=13131 RepID=A0AAV0WDU6_9HEMI|nr:unnamed protein product [Macrosiphum euphorbiae]
MVDKSSKSSFNSKKVEDPEIDERNQTVGECPKKTDESKQLPDGRIFLPYGVGPIIDCEIDDEGDEPDYLSYSKMPEEEDDVEDISLPEYGKP